jgi:hypothetical protein
MFILFGVLIFSIITTPAIAEIDPESYVWKQGLVQIITRGISACEQTTGLVEQYKTFATQSIRASKIQYRETAERANKKFEHFYLAQQSYTEAEKRYKEASELLAKSKKMYETAKQSTTRAQDEQLSTYRTLAGNQIRIASKTYKKALKAILEGNRAFNQGIRYFNTGVDNFNPETSEPLPKRYKFHRWPVEKLQ